MLLSIDSANKSVAIRQPFDFRGDPNAPMGQNDLFKQFQDGHSSASQDEMVLPGYVLLPLAPLQTMAPHRRQLLLRHLSLLISALASGGTSTTTTTSSRTDHGEMENIRIVKHHPLLPSSAGGDLRGEKESMDVRPDEHQQGVEMQRELEDEVHASQQMNATQVAVHAQLRFFLGHNADSQEAAAQINSHIRRFAPTNSDTTVHVEAPIIDTDPKSFGNLLSDQFLLQTIKLAQQRDSTSALLWSFASRQTPVLMFFDTSNAAL